jgi:hypothetical protein
MNAANVWRLSAPAFLTLTNVNFSEDRISEYFRQGIQMVATKGSALPMEPVAALQ